jgi:ribosomal protein S18 acetylase RimI-like enzyme
MMVSAKNDSRPVGTIWMLNLDESTPVVTPYVPAEFRRVDLHSTADLASPLRFITVAEFNRRLESGCQCYVACVDDQLAAYGWVSFDDEDIGELNLRVKLLPGESYIWDCATLPAYRGKHLYSALLVYILGELRAQGLCRAWIGADLANVASQKGMTRAGFHHVADLVIKRVQARRQVWVIGLPGEPESIVAEARRTYLTDQDKISLNSSTAMKVDSTSE